MKDFLIRPNEIRQITDKRGGCLVSDKITVDGKKVSFAYREMPDASFPNDTGWRFLAGDEDDEYLNNSGNFDVFNLNTICNYDDEVAQILDGKIGESYYRNTDSFVLDERPTFPDGATDIEKNADWKIIAKITDQDLGFNFEERITDKCRFSTRLILKRPNDGKICLIESKKHGYYQIPGGGIDAGESIEQGLKREAHEETGFELKNINQLGVTTEYRDGSKHEWTKAVSFCYVAESARDIGTKYMGDEIEEGFEPVWKTLDEAIAIFKNKDIELRNNANRSYSGSFSTRRDLEILKYYQVQGS